MADQSFSYTISSESSVTTADSKKLDSFLQKLFQDHPQFAAFSFPMDAIDPLAYLEMSWDEEAFQYYWEKPEDEFAIAAGDELCNISASGKNRFTKVSRQFEEIREVTAEFSEISHPYSGTMFLGGFSFFDNIGDSLWDSFQPASFSVPRWMIIKDGKFSLLTLAVKLIDFSDANELSQYLQDQLAAISKTVHHATHHINSTNGDFGKSSVAQNGSTAGRWMHSVDKARKLIEEQAFQKIVLARHLSVDKKPDIAPTQILNKLRQQYTSCYNFLIHHPTGKTFLGSTPERLGAFRNRLLLTEALAGSMQRGKTASEDSIFEKDLSSSTKDRDEHNFVIRDIEERLKPYVDSLDRKSQPEIKKLSNVQHLYTPIRARLKPGHSLLEVLSQLHPTPAVGGYPWNKASNYIGQLEDFDRGWYAGPVGWFNSKENGEFAVAIRSGLFTESKAHFFAGCGIVKDSDPQAEWEETNLKLKPMLSALQYD